MLLHQLALQPLPQLGEDAPEETTRLAGDDPLRNALCKTGAATLWTQMLH